MTGMMTSLTITDITSLTIFDNFSAKKLNYKKDVGL